ncbi:MAG: hypothetical protein J6P03_03730, partial [Opitutales bacterium]|nr:hypothetical protein [Opitutales bacterium]
MEKDMPSEEFLWEKIRSEAEQVSQREPALAALYEDVVLSRKNLVEAVAARLSRKLGSHAVPAELIREIINYTLSRDAAARQNICKDISAIYERDPACQSYLEPLM